MACNNSARRQWRKQEAVVGAAASEMRVQLHEADAGSRNPYSLARESSRYAFGTLLVTLCLFAVQQLDRTGGA